MKSGNTVSAGHTCERERGRERECICQYRHRIVMLHVFGSAGYVYMKSVVKTCSMLLKKMSSVCKRVFC